MAGLLRNKVVAITGSSSGIGRAVALACANQGASLHLHHMDDAKGHEDISTLQKELKSISQSQHTTFAANLTQSGVADSLISEATSKHCRLDVLVNNAGICQFSNYADVTHAMLQRHMDVNFTAAFMLTQAASKAMSTQTPRGGSIVNIASITATLGSAQLTHYSPTKAALLGMSVSYAAALGPAGVRFNSVCPGTTETSMNAADLDQGGKREEMASRVPLRRLGKPEDIARAVVFFSSDLSDYVTGQSLLVDGGASINYQ